MWGQAALSTPALASLAVTAQASGDVPDVQSGAQQGFNESNRLFAAVGRARSLSQRIRAACLCGDEAVGGISNSGDSGARAGCLLISLLPLIVRSLHDDGQVIDLLRRQGFVVSDLTIGNLVLII